MKNKLEGVLKGRLKEVLKDTKVFIDKQDSYRDKSLELTKSIKKRLNEDSNLGYEDFKDELITIEKNFFFDNLLAQNTSKYNVQLSILFQIAKLGEVDLGLDEEDIKILEHTLKTDFDLFKVTNGEVSYINNDFVKSIIDRIEQKDDKDREEHFNRMLQDPSFQELEV